MLKKFLVMIDGLQSHEAEPCPDDGRRCVNTAAHPEFVVIGSDAGFRIVLLKQLEANEGLLREILEELRRT